MIRKIIGFIPAALMFFLIWTDAALETRYFSPYAFRELLNTPWYLWLSLAASILSGVLLCIEKTLVPGLIIGAVSWLFGSVKMLLL